MEGGKRSNVCLSSGGRRSCRGINQHSSECPGENNCVVRQGGKQKNLLSPNNVDLPLYNFIYLFNVFIDGVARGLVLGEKALM